MRLIGILLALVIIGYLVTKQMGTVSTSVEDQGQQTPQAIIQHSEQSIEQINKKLESRNRPGD